MSWSQTTPWDIGAQVSALAVIAPGHPETTQSDITHLSTCEHLFSEQMTDLVLPGSHAIRVPNNSLGAVDCHGHVISQKLCLKYK